MRKKYLKLTDDQKARGIIFSSRLAGSTTIHEVHKDDEDKHKTIDRLMDDKFFNNSPFKYNEIRGLSEHK